MHLQWHHCMHTMIVLCNMHAHLGCCLAPGVRLIAPHLAECAYYSTPDMAMCVGGKTDHWLIMTTGVPNSISPYTTCMYTTCIGLQ